MASHYTSNKMKNPLPGKNPYMNWLLFSTLISCLCSFIGLLSVPQTCHSRSCLGTMWALDYFWDRWQTSFLDTGFPGMIQPWPHHPPTLQKVWKRQIIPVWKRGGWTWPSSCCQWRRVNGQRKGKNWELGRVSQQHNMPSDDQNLLYFEGKKKSYLFNQRSCVSKVYCVYFKLGRAWWLSGKESACQCRRPRFDLWVGKIPWGKE